MKVESVEGDPPLPADDAAREVREVGIEEVTVLVIGAGPAGISAALELGERGIDVLVVDDKDRPGGKLVLQTHSFFGSISDCHAGTRGIDIATLLGDRMSECPSVRTTFNTTCVGVFADGCVGLAGAWGYRLVRPKILLNAAGAREKSLSFPGCDLPGVYGAGAFQTLVNRDLVRPTERLFIIGGGNVGLIAAYHALQAGITVVGLAEALPRVGGYRVHRDKILRLGVPVHLSHSVVAAEGTDVLRSIVVARLDETFAPVPGTYRRFDVDTLLIAVGLNPVDEFARQAASFGMRVFSAGDAEEIAEASAAMFSGRIRGLEIARALGCDVEIPASHFELLDVLKKPGGEEIEIEIKPGTGGKYPLFRCVQKIPCNPCTEVCPKEAIRIPGGNILDLPVFDGECTACGRCVAICPGLAVTVVREDRDPTRKTAGVLVPVEMNRDAVPEGTTVPAVDADGAPLGEVRVRAVKTRKFQDRCLVVELEVPWELRLRVAGFRLQGPADEGEPCDPPDPGGEIVCKCERITRAEIEAEIRDGVEDLNQLKARLRCLMGACGGKTCTDEIVRIFRRLGVRDPSENPGRPFFSEVPLRAFAGGKGM
jgi:NADPH-dependent 2,4-dienoyl-CoA reductase/sulfur reductase-like enzyme/Fe-S-cluster-containing hydrogenase component 2